MNRCIICNGIQEKYISGKDFWLETSKKKYDIYKCKKCGLENIFPGLSDQEVAGLYKKNYYSYVKNNKLTLVTIIREYIFSFIYKISGVNKKYFNLKSYSQGKGKNFLDIGCGNGSVVQLMQKYKYISEGFEIGKKGKIGNIFYGNNINSIDFGKKYDLIHVHHVFEHINTPIRFLKKIKDILKDDGKCILILPDINCWSAKIFKEYAMERDIPRHLYNYNYTNLESLLKQNGFSIIKKSKLKQYSLFDSFNLYIKTKYNYNLGDKFYGKLLRYLTTLFIENILNILKNTNQMGFIIIKK